MLYMTILWKRFLLIRLPPSISATPSAKGHHPSAPAAPRTRLPPKTLQPDKPGSLKSLNTPRLG